MQNIQVLVYSRFVVLCGSDVSVFDEPVAAGRARVLNDVFGFLRMWRFSMSDEGDVATIGSRVFSENNKFTAKPYFTFDYVLSI